MLINRTTLATIYKILLHFFINITPPLLQARNYLQKLQKWVDFPRDPAPINFRLKLHNQPAPVANHRKLSILTTGPEPFHRYPSIFYVFPVSLEPFFPLFHLLLYNRKPIARPYYYPALSYHCRVLGHNIKNLVTISLIVTALSHGLLFHPVR